MDSLFYCQLAVLIARLMQVVLPTFILEKRSLLETFADCMAHPHLFLR